MSEIFDFYFGECLKYSFNRKGKFEDDFEYQIEYSIFADKKKRHMKLWIEVYPWGGKGSSCSTYIDVIIKEKTVRIVIYAENTACHCRYKEAYFFTRREICSCDINIKDAMKLKGYYEDIVSLLEKNDGNALENAFFNTIDEILSLLNIKYKSKHFYEIRVDKLLLDYLSKDNELALEMF